MRKTRQLPITILLTSLAILLSGCAHTTLYGRSIDPATFSLAAEATRPINLSFCDSPDRRHLGHQYLLIAIPFGSLELGNPTTFIKRRAYALLSLIGYKPLTDTTTSLKVPNLTVCLADASLTAYDLIFVRRAVSHVTLQLSYNRDGITTTVLISGSERAFVKFAFKDRLESLLNQAVDAALERGLQELGLYSKDPITPS